jgi:hypothetical protein
MSFAMQRLVDFTHVVGSHRTISLSDDAATSEIFNQSFIHCTEAF